MAADDDNRLAKLLGYRWNWRLRGIVTGIGSPAAANRPAAPMMVIGGCGSSGTTLLRRMLDRHPAISCGPESTVFLSRISRPEELAARFGFRSGEIAEWQFNSPNQAAFIDRFRRACLARGGKNVWADKTPENIRRFAFVRRHFPDAYLVHVIRDGRDVACSLRRQRWMKLRNPASPEALAQCAAYWAERVHAGRSLRHDARYIEIRYEDLIQRPEATMRQLLAFCGVDWDPRVLLPDTEAGERSAGPIFSTSVGRWRYELAASEAAMIELASGGLLSELGYAATPAQPRGEAGGTAVDRARKKWSRLERVWIELRTVGRALTDRRINLAVRLLSLLGFVYQVAPVDVIPNRIPVLGYLDNVAVFPLAVWLFISLAPRTIIREHRSIVAALLARHGLHGDLGGRPAE